MKILRPVYINWSFAQHFNELSRVSKVFLHLITVTEPPEVFFNKSYS